VGISREVYFDAVRETLFAGALTQQQVDGQNVLLSLWEHGDAGTPMDDGRWLGYCLATVYWETGTKMWAVREIGEGVGMDYGAPDVETGETYYGRGLVQLTWKDNYAKASHQLGLVDERDLVWFPDLALDSLVAARILYRGCAEGWFTGQRLNDYFSDKVHDPVNARKIVNGLDHAEEIAALFDAFMEQRNEVIMEVTAGIRVTVNGLVVEP
jgi:hypothetical protein